MKMGIIFDLLITRNLITAAALGKLNRKVQEAKKKPEQKEETDYLKTVLKTEARLYNYLVQNRLMRYENSLKLRK